MEWSYEIRKRTIFVSHGQSTSFFYPISELASLEAATMYDRSWATNPVAAGYPRGLLLVARDELIDRGLVQAAD